MKPENLDTTDLSKIGARAESWADFLKLPLGHRVWRGMSGDFQGSGIGSSLDFQDHRNYVPGDDPRHINWQAYARSGNYTMKLYREEVRPLVDLVFDVSQSMFVTPAKTTRSLELFYFLVHAILKSGASGRFYLATSGGHEWVTPEALHGHVWVNQAEAMAASQSSLAPELVNIPFRAQSMRLLLSDLLFAGDAEPVLRSLAGQRGFGSVFAPFCDEEAEPDWSGNYEFIDAEDVERYSRRVQVELLRRYRDAYQRHFASWKELGRKHDVAIVRVSSQTDFLEAIRFEGVASGAIELVA